MAYDALDEFAKKWGSEYEYAINSHIFPIVPKSSRKNF